MHPHSIKRVTRAWAIMEAMHLQRPFQHRYHRQRQPSDIRLITQRSGSVNMSKAQWPQHHQIRICKIMVVAMHTTKTTSRTCLSEPTFFTNFMNIVDLVQQWAKNRQAGNLDAAKLSWKPIWNVTNYYEYLQKCNGEFKACWSASTAFDTLVHFVEDAHSTAIHCTCIYSFWIDQKITYY